MNFIFRCLVLCGALAASTVFTQDIVDLSPKPGAKYPVPVLFTGKVVLEPKTLFFGHQTWFLQQDLSRWYREDSGDRNKVEVLVSLKFRGPAYVKDSKKENGICIDRFLLIR